MDYSFKNCFRNQEMITFDSPHFQEIKMRIINNLKFINNEKINYFA